MKYDQSETSERGRGYDQSAFEEKQKQDCPVCGRLIGEHPTCEACAALVGVKHEQLPIYFRGHLVCGPCFQRWQHLNQFYLATEGRVATWEEMLSPPSAKYLDWRTARPQTTALD